MQRRHRAASRLLLPLLALALVAPACRGDDVPCTVTCDTADAWCRATFGRGGNVTATACNAHGLTCTCNDVSSIRVMTWAPSPTDAAPAPQQRCFWSDVFDDVLPIANACWPLTGVCPRRCDDITTAICDTTRATCATTTAAAATTAEASSHDSNDQHTGFDYSCSMCSGRVYRITGDARQCNKSYDDAAECNAATVCGGHGCCNTAADRDTRPCVCFDDAARGHWTGAACQECTADYTRNAAGLCVVARPRIEVILTSIARTWTMVLPNLAVVFLFVVCGLARRPWESDTTFEATTLRRARLSAIHLERRRRRAAAAARHRARQQQQRRLRRPDLAATTTYAATAAAREAPPQTRADTTALWF